MRENVMHLLWAQLDAQTTDGEGPQDSNSLAPQERVITRHMSDSAALSSSSSGKDMSLEAVKNDLKLQAAAANKKSSDASNACVVRCNFPGGTHTSIVVRSVDEHTVRRAFGSRLARRGFKVEECVVKGPAGNIIEWDILAYNALQGLSKIQVEKIDPVEVLPAAAETADTELLISTTPTEVASVNVVDDTKQPSREAEVLVAPLPQVPHKEQPLPSDETTLTNVPLVILEGAATPDLLAPSPEVTVSETSAKEAIGQLVMTSDGDHATADDTERCVLDTKNELVQSASNSVDVDIAEAAKDTLFICINSPAHSPSPSTNSKKAHTSPPSSIPDVMAPVLDIPTAATVNTEGPIGVHVAAHSNISQTASSDDATNNNDIVVEPRTQKQRMNVGVDAELDAMVPSSADVLVKEDNVESSSDHQIVQPSDDGNGVRRFVSQMENPAPLSPRPTVRSQKLTPGVSPAVRRRAASLGASVTMYSPVHMAKSSLATPFAAGTANDFAPSETVTSCTTTQSSAVVRQSEKAQFENNTPAPSPTCARPTMASFKKTKTNTTTSTNNMLEASHHKRRSAPLTFSAYTESPQYGVRTTRSPAVRTTRSPAVSRIANKFAELEKSSTSKKSINYRKKQPAQQASRKATTAAGATTSAKVTATSALTSRRRSDVSAGSSTTIKPNGALKRATKGYVRASVKNRNSKEITDTREKRHSREFRRETPASRPTSLRRQSTENGSSNEAKEQEDRAEKRNSREIRKEQVFGSKYSSAENNASKLKEKRQSSEAKEEIEQVHKKRNSREIRKESSISISCRSRSSSSTRNSAVAAKERKEKRTGDNAKGQDVKGGDTKRIKGVSRVKETRQKFESRFSSRRFVPPPKVHQIVTCNVGSHVCWAGRTPCSQVKLYSMCFATLQLHNFLQIYLSACCHGDPGSSIP